MQNIKNDLFFGNQNAQYSCMWLIPASVFSSHLVNVFMSFQNIENQGGGSVRKSCDSTFLEAKELKSVNQVCSLETTDCLIGTKWEVWK